MGNEVKNNKFTWVINNFSSLESRIIYSDHFVIGGCKWFLMAYPKGIKDTNYMSLYLNVAEYKSLPSEWRRHAKYSFMIVNQIPRNFSKLRESQAHLNEKTRSWGFPNMFPLDELKAKDSGFLVNGDLKIVVEIELVEVVGPLDVLKETSSVMDSIDVKGFQVLSTQVESVKRLFDKHPDIALEFRPKNQHLRTACINVVLSLIEILRKSLQKLSNDDLVEADSALAYLKYAGFKVTWLEQKLEEVKQKKKEEQSCEIRVQELEKELKEFKQKRSDIKTQLEKEKANVLASRAHLTLDDFF